MDVFDVGALIAVTWFSFVMSWHCGMMCGPLVCAKLVTTGNTRRQTWGAVCLYNMGRCTSYIAAGAAVGILSSEVQDRLASRIPGAGIVVTMVFVLMLAVQGFLLLLNREVTWAPEIFTRAMSRMLSRIGRVRGWGGVGFFMFGLVTALLPCMTLTSALSAAAMTGDGRDGALMMLGFVLGTLPVMIVVPVFAADFSSWVSRRIPVAAVRRFAGVFLILAACMTVLRLMG
jgi:sulfite exporter TauE/SafE